MKIIAVDNFARETVSDRLIAEKVPEHLASKIVEFLNDTESGPDAPLFFKAVPDDYQLYEWDPNA